MDDKPILIVLDANIWISSHLLKSALGAALLYAISNTGAQILLPEITNDELIEGTIEMGLKAADKITQGFSTVQTLVGRRPDYKLPTEAELRQVTEERIKELDDMLVKASLTLDQCRKAVKRIIAKLPPNKEKTEEFRDSLLWEVMLENMPKSQVHFVTNDGDFYEGHNKKQGCLASKLKEEVLKIGGKFCIYSDLESIVAVIQERVSPPDYSKLAGSIDVVIIPQLRQYAQLKGLSFGGLIDHKIEAFLTERINVLALTFDLTYPILAIQEDEERIPSGSVFRVVGNCFYDTSSELVSEAILDRIEAVDSQGNKIPGIGTTYFAVASFIIGTPLIPYSLKKPIQG